MPRCGLEYLQRDRAILKEGAPKVLDSNFQCNGGFNILNNRITIYEIYGRPAYIVDFLARPFLVYTFESDFEIWEDFWRLITIKRDSFYNRYKKSGLGFVTIYPIFISSDQISALMQARNLCRK